MKKYALITSLLVLATLTSSAQDRLIHMDDTQKPQRKSTMANPLFETEKARLLMPNKVEFGVECIPSFTPEWTLTYDSVSHALVYKIAKKSIWYTTYRATHKTIKIDKHHSKSVPLKRPKNYKAPHVSTYSMTISDEQVEALKNIWTTAVSAAVDKKILMLDGVRWTYFINGKRAKTHNEKNVLVKFTDELVNAIMAGDKERKDSLFATSQKVITGLTTPPPPEILEPGTVNKLIIVDGIPLADSVTFINVPNTFGELVYFNKRHKVIHSISYHYDKEKKKPLEDKYGVKVKGIIAEYTTSPDTLCDAYVREHPEVMQTRRYVEGYVLDGDGRPQADAWVHIEGKSQMGTGTATDSTGHFAFWVPRTATMLTASNGHIWVNRIPITDSSVTIHLKKQAR